MSSTYKVLVTAVGGLIGYGIVNSLRKSSYDLEIFGMDIYPDAYGRYRADHFIQGVRGDDPEFIPFLSKVVKEHQIDLVFSSIEPEIYRLYKHRDELPCPFVLNNDLCISLSADKLATYQFLKDKIQLIPTLHNTSFDQCTEAFGLPFLLKPVQSSASRGIHIITSREEFEFYTKQVNGACIYQKIVGSDEEEYTVAVFGDGQGGFADHIILRRTLAHNGATEKAVLIKTHPRIMQYVEKLCELLQPVGPTNIQARIDEKEVYLLEVNARISSTCSFRAEIGYNEPEMCIRHYLTGEAIEPTEKTPACLVRYISDHINYEQDCDHF